VGVVVLAAAGVGVGVLLNRMGSQSVGLSVPTATYQPPPTTAPAPTPSKYTAPLQDLAIPMPAGATRESLRMGADDGSMQLEDVVAEYPDSSKAQVRKILTDLEFERGLFLAWTDAQGYLVYLQINQFHFERQAATWSVTDRRSMDSVTETTAGFDEIVGGKWLTSSAPNGRGAAHAFFSKGDLTVTIGIFKTGKGDADYVKRLAVEQYNRLPAWS
jgi:hypothetical protein